jgi:hypothetical protein
VRGRRDVRHRALSRHHGHDGMTDPDLVTFL